MVKLWLWITPFYFTNHSLNMILPWTTIIFNYPLPLLPNHLADCHISPSWLTTSTFFRLEITSYQYLRSSVFFKILHAHLLQVYCIYSVQSLTCCLYPVVDTSELPVFLVTFHCDLSELTQDVRIEFFLQTPWVRINFRAALWNNNLPPLFLRF